MFRQFIIILFLLFSSNLFANEYVGFKAGNEMVSQYIYGTIHVYCPRTSRMHSCRMDYLEPGDRDKFVHPAIDANEVELIALHEQGSTTKKKKKFDAVQGQSKRYFNLWLGSLLQRPLLRSGSNKITYNLYKNGTQVKSGEFVANVKEAPAKRCRDRVYHVYNDNDCTNIGIMCQRYFSEQAYCQ